MVTIWRKHTASYRVDLSYAYDYDLDLSWDETGEVSAAIAEGDLAGYVMRVRVTHRRTGIVIGEDYLGGCILSRPEEFVDHTKTARGRYGSYLRDMVSSAIARARDAHTSLCLSLP